MYRVTHHVGQNLLLTLKHEFCLGLAKPSQHGTYVLKSTGGFGQHDGSPCMLPLCSVISYVLTSRARSPVIGQSLSFLTILVLFTRSITWVRVLCCCVPRQLLLFVTIFFCVSLKELVFDVRWRALWSGMRLAAGTS